MINPDPTAERRAATWVQLLTLWKTNNLPSPESIDAGSGAVWLPPNERGQVDAWGAALGLRPATVGPAGPLLSGKERTSTYYSANDGAGRLSVMCNLSLGDASDHWSPTKEAALSALESALASTAEHLTAEPACPTQDGHLADYGPNVPTPAEPVALAAEPTSATRVYQANGKAWDYDADQGRWSHRSGDGMSTTVVWDDLFADGPVYLDPPAAPVAVSPEPLPIPATPDDLAAAFPADPHVTAAMELTPAGQLAKPVTVSPERVAEILADLNRIEASDSGSKVREVDSYVRSLHGLESDDDHPITRFRLVDGPRFDYDGETETWSAVPQ